MQPVDFSEFRSNTKPPLDSLGQPGDVFFHTRELSLRIRLPGPQGWSQPWDGSYKNRLAHPLYNDRYLWIIRGIGDAKRARTELRLEFRSAAVIQKNLFAVSSECFILIVIFVVELSLKDSLFTGFLDLLRSLKTRPGDHSGSSQSHSGKRKMLADEVHADSAQVDEELPVSQTPQPQYALNLGRTVISDAQLGRCKIRLRVHSSLPTSSARVHFEFKESSAEGRDFFISVDAEESLARGQQPGSQQVQVQAQATTATVIKISTSLKPSQTRREAGAEISTTNYQNLDSTVQDLEYSDGLREWHLGLLFRKLYGSGETSDKDAMVTCVCCA